MVVNLTATSTVIVCQSPSLDGNFMTFTLTHDSSSNITKGFLGYCNDAPEYLLIDILLATALHFPHPVLLPVLALGFWCQSLP